MAMAVSAVYSSSNLLVKPPAGQALTVAEALVTLSVYRTGSVAIQDTSANISSSLGELQKLSSRITGVTLTQPDDAINLRASQLRNATALLSKINGNYKLKVQDALVSDMAVLNTNARVQQYNITDNATNVSAKIDSLQASAKLGSVNLTGLLTNLTLTYNQLSNAADTLAKITNNYTLTVNDVSVANTALVAQNTRVATINIKDTSQKIGEGIDVLDDLVSRIGKINGTDRGVISLTSTAYNTGSIVLGKIYTGYQIAIQSATLAETLNATRNARVQTVKVQDSGSNFVANLASLNRVSSKLTSIDITDSAAPISLTYAQYTTYANLLGKITTPGVTFAVTGVSLANLASVQSKTAVTSIGLSDTAANVSLALDSLKTNNVVNSIVLTGSKNTISLTADQLEQDKNVLDEITNAYTLAVSRVKAQDAVAVGTTSGVTSVSVTDSAAQISSYFDDLVGLGNTLKSVTRSDMAVIALNASQYTNGKSTLGKMSGSYPLSVSGVDAQSATSVIADSRVQSLTVSDVGKRISAYFNNLDLLGAKLTAITQVDNAKIELVQSQYLSKQTTLNKINEGQFSVGVSGVSAGYAAQISQDTSVATLDVLDNGQNTINYLHDLAIAAVRDGLTLKISITNPKIPLALTAAQYDVDKLALSAISSNYSLAVSDVAADDATAYAGYAKVSSVAVKDTGTNITSTLDALASLGDKVSRITLDQSNVLNWTASQYALNAAVLNKIKNAFVLNVNDVAAANALKLASQKNVSKIYVTDTARNISTFLNSLAYLDGKLAGVTKTDTPSPLDISANDWLSDTTTLQKINAGDYSVNVYGATAAQVSAMAADPHVIKVNVTDTAVNLVNKLDVLDGIAPDLLGDITITGNALISLNASQLKAYDSVLSKITNNHSYAVTDANVADALNLSSRTDVSTVAVFDLGSAIGGHIASLTAMGGKLKSLTIADSSPIQLSAAQYAANTATLKKITNSYGLALTGVSTQNAVTWSGVGSIVSMDIVDTLSNISSRLDALNSFNRKINQVNTTENGLLTITAAQLGADAAVLSKVDAAISLRVKNMSVAAAIASDIPTRISKLTVSDSSANIANSLDALQALSDKLESITQIGSALPMSITAAQLGDDANALAKISNNYNLRVSEVKAADVQAIGASPRVYSLAVKDDVAAIKDNLPAIQTLGAKVTAIVATDPSTHLALSATQYASYRGAINKLESGVLLDLSEAKAATASALVQDARVALVNVSDTATGLSINLDSLNGLAAKLGNITLTDVSPLNLTVTQFKSNALALSRFNTVPDIKVRNVLASEAVSLVASLADFGSGSSISVSDNASQIKAYWGDLNTLSSNEILSGVAVLDPRNTMALTNEQWMASTGLLQKLTGAYSYSVSGMTIADAQTLLTNDPSHAVSVAIRDSSSNIAANLDALQALGAKVSSISQVGIPGALSLTRPQMLLNAATLAKITDGYTIDLSEATASQALSLATDAKVVSVSIKDTANNISSNWSALSELRSKLTNITVSDNSNLSITESQLNVNGAVVLLMPNNQIFVNNAQAEHASEIATAYPNALINVVDTAQDIADHIDTLAGLLDSSATLINSIRVTDHATISVTADQWKDKSAIFGKFAGSYDFMVKDVGASDASTVSSGDHVSGITVLDTSANVYGKLSELEALAAAGQLTDITLKDNDVMHLTQAQYNSFAHALSLIKSNLTLDVTDVAVSDADEVSANTAVVSMTVKDTAQNITTHLIELNALGQTLTGVSISDTNEIAMSYTQFVASTDLISKISGGSIAVNSTPLDRLNTLLSDSMVTHIGLVGGSQDLANRWDDLLFAEPKITSITQSVPIEDLFITAIQLSNSAGLLGKFSDSYSLSVSGVAATAAKSLADDHAYIQAVQVSDTSQNISANLNDLLALGSRLTSISVTDSSPLAITAAQYLDNPQLDVLLAGQATFNISGITAADALTIASHADVASMSLVDSADHIASNLNALQGISSKVSDIAFTDALPVFTVDVADWQADSSVIGKFSSTFGLVLTNVNAADATVVAGSTIPANVNQLKLSIEDSEQNILNKLADLNSLAIDGKLLQVSVTDTHELNLSQQDATNYASLLSVLSAQDSYNIIS